MPDILYYHPMVMLNGIKMEITLSRWMDDEDIQSIINEEILANGVENTITKYHAKIPIEHNEHLVTSD